MNHLRPVDTLIVDIAIDNLSDNYSSKPSHISPEFNNVMAAGATEISGPTLCCAQLGLALTPAPFGNQLHHPVETGAVVAAVQRVVEALAGQALGWDDAAERFAEIVSSGERVNFVARPAA